MSASGQDSTCGNMPKYCNRTPFLSDGSCDRGSVDIYQFDDFPFCDGISPTEAGIPPEIVDTPIVMQVPPSCACINLTYDLNLQYSANRAFVAEAVFSADGDCCEGNYGTNFNLQIPCPVIANGRTSRRISMQIGYGSSGESVSAAYVQLNEAACTIQPNDVDFDLRIPCPVRSSRTNRIRMSIGWGSSSASASVSYITNDHENCTMSTRDVEINLSLPCPVSKSRLDIETSYEYATSSDPWGSFTLSKDSYDEDSCARSLKFKIRFPKIDGETIYPDLVSIDQNAYDLLEIAHFADTERDETEALSEKISVDTETGEVTISDRSMMLLARKGGNLVYVPLTGGGGHEDDDGSSDPCIHPGSKNSDQDGGVDPTKDDDGSRLKGVKVSSLENTGGVADGGEAHVGDDDCNC